MKRPHLNKIETKTPLPPAIYITMRPDQWDKLLEAAYDDGHCLIEMGSNEQILNIYQKPKETN